LDKITAHLSAYVQHIGKARVDACEEIVLPATVGHGAPRMERLDTYLTSVCYQTSDEVGLALIRLKRFWRIHPVDYRWDEGPDLLRLTVLGVAGALGAAEARAEGPEGVAGPRR
jgi:hypothetical protein